MGTQLILDKEGFAELTKQQIDEADLITVDGVVVKSRDATIPVGTMTQAHDTGGELAKAAMIILKAVNSRGPIPPGAQATIMLGEIEGIRGHERASMGEWEIDVRRVK